MATRSGPSTRITVWVARRQLKPGRRPIRHFRDHLDRFRPREQPQRPQRRLALHPCRPVRLLGRGQMMLRRRRHHRAFRNMGVLRQVHDHAPSADPRGDAVDQGGQFVIVVHIGIEIALLLHHDLDAAGGQANEIEAETGIERIVQGIEPLAKQPVDHLGLGHGLSGVDRDRANHAVGAEEMGLQPPRALALPVHRRDQHPGQTGQASPRSRLRSRPVRRNRFSTM